ncbi:MAG TPA: efflux RND transporter periplasmic adaptor subunit [Bryobacteraceae bacterium]|nr:efflux RND transporter periplasmic adaptor subunit [Bryobacteraceae bacterium]
MSLLLSCSSRPPAAPASEAVPVKTGKVRHYRQAPEIALSGSIESPEEPSDLSFLVAGKVVRVIPREGEFVRKGQLLAQVDPVDYQLALDAAAAQARAARAQADKAQGSARPEQLEQARLAFRRTEDEYRRMKFLFDSKSLAPNDFQKFETAYLSAKEQYELAKTGAQKEDKAQASAGFEQAAAAQRIAAKRLADTRLTAPMDGYVSRRMVEPGVVVAPGRPAFTLVRLDPVEVRVGIPETDLRRVRIGQRAIVRIPALGDDRFTGTVRVINVSADPATRTYMARIVVPNPRHTLRVGMIAEVAIQGDGDTDAIALPGEAIVRDPQGATLVYVYYPGQKKVYSKRVEVGTVLGKEVQIRGGLSGDELIVVGGQQMLRDGVTVEAQFVPAAPGEAR